MAKIKIGFQNNFIRKLRQIRLHERQRLLEAVFKKKTIPTASVDGFSGRNNYVVFESSDTNLTVKLGNFGSYNYLLTARYIMSPTDRNIKSQG